MQNIDGFESCWKPRAVQHFHEVDARIKDDILFMSVALHARSMRTVSAHSKALATEKCAYLSSALRREAIKIKHPDLELIEQLDYGLSITRHTHLQYPPSLRMIAMP